MWGVLEKVQATKSRKEGELGFIYLSPLYYIRQIVKRKVVF
jgi:hypothetical protein